MGYENYMNQNALEKQAKENESNGGQDLTKYLNIRPTMKNGDTMKVTVVRLLPSKNDPSTPFEYIHCHAFYVGGKFNTFICPTKNSMAPIGETCPLCELSKAYFDARDNAAMPQQKDDLKKRGATYMAKGYWVVRCIERSKEAEGVKWFRFADQSMKHDGMKDDLDKLNVSKREVLKSQGQLPNANWTMYDLNDGYDIVITCTGTVGSDGKENFTYAFSTVDQRSTLHPDINVGMKWINDPVRWSDVYKVKPFAYLEILALGGEPRYSKDEQRYYDHSGKVDGEKYPQYKAPVTYNQMQENQQPQGGGYYQQQAGGGYYQQQQGYYQQQAPTQQPIYAQQQGYYQQQAPAQQQPAYQQQPMYAQQQPVYQQQPSAQTQAYQPQAQQPAYEPQAAPAPQQAPVQQQPVYAQQQPQQQPVYAQQATPAMAAPAMEVNQAEADKLPF